jgi:TRAP-type C4-dicarboxylate transport system permease small subunit
MINKVNLVNNIVEQIEKWLVITSFSLMVIFSFLNVILRALYTKFNIQFANTLLTSLDWSEPFARLMVLWVTFLGASLLTKDNRHIRIDIMGHFLSPLLLSLRELILSIACAVVCFFMVRASIGYISMEMEYGSGSVMGIDAWKWEIIIPLGFGLMLFRFLLNTLKEIIKMSSGETAK